MPRPCWVCQFELSKNGGFFTPFPEASHFQPPVVLLLINRSGRISLSREGSRAARPARTGWLDARSTARKSPHVSPSHQGRSAGRASSRLERAGDRHVEQHPQEGRSQMTEPLKYAVVIERAGANYSAYVPDLPGCISVGG